MLVGALTRFVTRRHARFLEPNRAARISLFVLLAAAFPSPVARIHTQSGAPADAVAPVARLVGEWNGTAEGQAGKGQVERQYERVLGSKFIQVRNRTSYLPQEKNPKGETHADIGFSSVSTPRGSESC
jgi:hypothetical protein